MLIFFTGELINEKKFELFLIKLKSLNESSAYIDNWYVFPMLSNMYFL